MTWKVERYLDGVEALHSLGIPDAPVRTVRWCVPERPALVLGSAQSSDDVDEVACAEVGVDVVRRRSGGGAVLVEPQSLVWVDVVVPAGDSLWEHDVGRAFWWLGDVWVEALMALGVSGGVHKGGLVTTAWSRKVCFAGLGPGEITSGGRKVVGVSQRRTKAGSLFQCALPLRFDGARMAGLLRLDSKSRAELTQVLEANVTSVDLDAVRVEEAFLDALTSSQ